MAALTAFCDETGTHGCAPLTCVGGYVFDEDGQKAFTEKWAEVMEPLRRRGIRYFHAAPCNAGDEPFSNLNFAERQALFGDLISLVRDTAKFGMAAGIEDHIFKEVMERNKVQEFTGSKYTACALRSLSSLQQWADEQGFDGKILYRFESGNEHQGEADCMMRCIADSPDLSKRFRYEGHSFEPKYSLLPLQAADLWVWLWQRAFSDENWSAYLRSLLRKPGHIPHYVHHMTDLSLNMLALVNMTYGVKSNREYERQNGKVRTYRF